MKLLVTNQNLKHIEGVFKKLLKDKSFSSQSFYPAAKKRQKIFDTLGLRMYVVESSSTSFYKQSVVKHDFMFEKGFVRIHNNLDVYGVDEDTHSRYRAFLIEVGDVIEIKGNSVYITGRKFTDKKEKVVRILKINQFN